MEALDQESTAHPEAQELYRFGEGLLAADEAAALEEHLSVCNACCRLLEGAPFDSFVARLREAQAPPSAVTQHCGADPTRIHANENPGDLADHARYRVIRLLGRGGMGAVYLAEHRRMGRLVALKVVNPDLLNNSRARMRFQQEVKTAAKLDHANIVAAYDADQAGSSHFLVMEYVEGQNLADYLAKTGPLSVPHACEIVRQAALGLQHAHERGMVHRDIKPANLMLTPAGHVKVLDFGLARFASEPASAVMSADAAMVPHLTGSGAVMGSADYIAPEQARDAHLADGRSDVYSLGCTLYHLLIGQPPFPDGTAWEKLRLHTTDAPAQLRNLRPEIHEELVRIVARMMAKRPEDRYQTAEKVAIALKGFASSPGGVRRLRRAWLALAVALFAGPVCAVGVSYLSGTLPPNGAESEFVQPENAALPPVQPAPTNVGEVRRWQAHDPALIYRIVAGRDGRSAWSVGQRDFCRSDLATGKISECVATPIGIEELVMAPDGRQFLATDNQGGMIRFFDTATMKQVRAVPGPVQYWQAAWFPGADRFLTGGVDGVGRIWDVKEGKPIRELKGHPSCVSCVAVSQDGTRVLTGTMRDGNIMVWNLGDDFPDFIISEQVCHPYSAHFVLGGKAILSCCRNGSICLVDAQTGKQVRVFRTKRRDNQWTRIALLADGRHFASAGSDGYLRLWDMETGRELYKGEADELAYSLAVTPDGRNLLLGTNQGEIVQWRLPELPPPDKKGANLLVTADVSGNGKDQSNPAAPANADDRIWLDGYLDIVWAVAFSPNGRYTLTTGRRNYLHDRSDNRLVRRLGGGIWFATFAPDSRHALTNDLFMTGIVLWDVQTGEMVRRYSNPATRGRVLNAGFSHDGKYVAASEWDVLRVYKKETGEVVMSVPTNSGCRPTFAFTPAGRLLAVHRNGRSIHTYEIGTAKELEPPLLSPDPLFSLALSPDGKTILANRANAAEVLVWEADKQDPVRRLVEEKAKRCNDQQVVFLPCGRRALATTIDGTMTLWDVATGRQLQRWEGLGGIVSLAVSPDGCWALCGLTEMRAFLLRLPDPPAPEKIGGKRSERTTGVAIEALRTDSQKFTKDGRDGNGAAHSLSVSMTHVVEPKPTQMG